MHENLMALVLPGYKYVREDGRYLLYLHCSILMAETLSIKGQVCSDAERTVLPKASQFMCF